MTKGICRNAPCPNGTSETPIERYPGPGEYCPECGERLQPLPETPSKPFGGLTPLEALQKFEVDRPAQAVRAAVPRFKRFGVASVAVCVAVAGALVVLGPRAMGHQRGETIRVCRSSMTDRFAADIIAAYAVKSGTPASHFELARSGSCDVAFAVTDDAAAGAVVGRDAIVAVVNPQNAMVRLSQGQLRQIFNGEMTDWSQAGGKPGRIVAILPDASTDEAQTASKTLLHDLTPAPSVRRVASSAEVVRAVVSGAGRNAVGLVAFSAAVPAKVLVLAAAPAPSWLSIADARYPLSLGVTVEAPAQSHAPGAAALVQYARSDEAQSLVSRDGLVPKKGF